MADAADVAGESEQFILAATLAARLPEGPAATGACLNCGEGLCAGHRWCDSDCRRDWELLQRRS